jgi:caffeoyl-CoA O-methyltransferase
MAKVLPNNGRIVSLEIDPFVVDFGLDMKVKSDAFWKISHMVGPAEQSLEALMQRARKEYSWKPFDMIIIDADKAGMMEYFEILSETPGMVADNALFCVDVTPFKGQISTPYAKPGKEDSYLINSGQAKIDHFRRSVVSSQDFYVEENSGLLQITKKRKFSDCTVATNPLASFPNDHNIKTQVIANWAAPRQADLVAELRKAVINTDWASLFTEQVTQNLVATSWSANEERCERLQSLCRSSGAKFVLEIGAFCGIATLAMAEALPADGHILSLELDPFVAAFGEDIKAKSNARKKITQMIGPAKDSLKTIVHCGKQRLVPFDMAIIDADKASMTDYFRFLWETPGLMSPDAVICVDTAPFKGQMFAPYVKGKLDDWIVKSGCESIDAFIAHVRNLADADMAESNGLVAVRRRR